MEPVDHSDLDRRLPIVRVRDVVLAALQTAFAADNLVGDDTPNAFQFVPGDPSKSAVWITTPEGRAQYTGRDGRRQLITVERGDYVPQDLHLQNLSGRNFSDEQRYSDLTTSMLAVRCESGSETGSEVLASICYSVLKIFRMDLMTDYDIHNYKLISISPPVLNEEIPGRPWVTTVMLRVELQEFAFMREIGNHLNRIDVEQALNELPSYQGVVSLDSSPGGSDE